MEVDGADPLALLWQSGRDRDADGVPLRETEEAVDIAAEIRADALASLMSEPAGPVFTPPRGCANVRRPLGPRHRRSED
jgi:hypothetical protein